MNNKGVIGRERRSRAVLDRYAVLLQYGFSLKIDKGNKHWQNLAKAKDLRDYYTHIEAMKSRAISSEEVFDYMEAVMLGIIWPSAEIQRTILLGIHDLYYMWVQLTDLARDHLPEGHVEQPFFHPWKLAGRSYMFYCPFTNVDEEKFPNSQEEMARSKREGIRIDVRCVAGSTPRAFCSAYLPKRVRFHSPNSTLACVPAFRCRANARRETTEFVCSAFCCASNLAKFADVFEKLLSQNWRIWVATAADGAHLARSSKTVA